MLQRPSGASTSLGPTGVHLFLPQNKKPRLMSTERPCAVQRSLLLLQLRALPSRLLPRAPDCLWATVPSSKNHAKTRATAGLMMTM